MKRLKWGYTPISTHSLTQHHIPRYLGITRRIHITTTTTRTRTLHTTNPSNLAKRKTTVSLLALPQGALSLQPLPELPRVKEPQYSYVIAQARENIDRFGECVVLTRVGGFYELYFEQAEEVGPGLGLKVGRKRGRGQEGGVAMDMSRHVAIAEEFPNPNKDEKEHASYGLLWERRVVRIITPGTLIDEKFMDPWENNYLLCVWPGGGSSSSSSSTSTSTSSSTSSSSSSGDEGEGQDSPVGLAWLDLSTGDFFTQGSTRGALTAELARIGPREIVIDESCRDTPEVTLLTSEKRLLTFHTSTISPLDTKSWASLLESSTSTSSVSSSKSLLQAGGFGNEEISAGSTLLSYVKEKLQGLSMKLQPPVRRSKENNMLIDAVTMRALEIRSTLKDGVVGGVGTLLKTVRRTVTRGGTRRLGSWLTSPETSVKIINDRLNLVEHFIASPKLLEDIRYKLKLTHDSQRLVQKMSLGRGDADDLVSLARTIIQTQDIVDCISSHLPRKKESLEVVKELIGRIEKLEELAARILRSIDENGLMLRHTIEDREAAEITALAEAVERGRALSEEEGEGEEGLEEGEEEVVEEEKPKKRGRKKATTTTSTTKTTAKKTIKPRTQRILKEVDREKVEPWIMHPTASKTLTKLHESLEELMTEKQLLETRLLDESMLSEHLVALKWTPSLGHILHIKSRTLPDMTEGILSSAISVGSSKSTHSYHLPEWTKLGSRIEMARLAIRAEEQKVLQDIRKQVILNIHALRRNATVLDELDIAAGFAVLAKESGWVRPILNMSTEHKIVGGRHATVQRSLDDLGRTFVANDCWVGGEEGMWIITGPNMAGKSTFLRQNALISILAQTGSYVPADHAEIGIIDQIFSRVGSADDLYRSQSTFMVEMIETAYILKNATPRSFVIMDEVGRGTTVDDGFAIAGGVVRYLWEVCGCRVLFATHFHGLVELVEGWEKEEGKGRGKGKGRKKIGAYCTDLVEDEKGGWMFVHKLRKGVNKRSHAVKVARMAGLPQLALKTAEDILKAEKFKRG
ncbi:DNA mismatch repair ATPase msh1 [Orbilia oligospora]|nr:DNA mismatch repair ATPase msh1 [Orbilia oligospora]